MALERGTFKFGGVTFPLDVAANTGNALLEDADPAIHHALAFFAGVLDTHLGARWEEAAAAAGFTDEAAAIVRTQVPFSPEDYLTEGQFAFPLLAVYRDTESYGDHTTQYGWSIQAWRVEYVLPPLTLAQAELLQPLLSAVVKVLVDRAHEGGDPEYNDGERVWESAGVDQIAAKRATYGKYPGAQGVAFPSVQLEFEVYEQQATPTGAFDEVTSTGTALDVVDPSDDSEVTDFIEFEEPPEPTP